MTLERKQMGWTGRDCPFCSGTGLNYSAASTPICQACGGSGDEWGDLSLGPRICSNRKCKRTDITLFSPPMFQSDNRFYCTKHLRVAQKRANRHFHFARVIEIVQSDAYTFRHAICAILFHLRKAL